MAKGLHKEVGHGFDGPFRFTFAVLIGLFLVISGVGLIAYFGGMYSYLFGVPLLLLGLALPIFLELVIARKRP